MDDPVQRDQGVDGELLMQLHETPARVGFSATDVGPAGMNGIAHRLVRQSRSTLTQTNAEPAPLARDDVM